jgi:hypothetical protein
MRGRQTTATNIPRWVEATRTEDGDEIEEESTSEEEEEDLEEAVDQEGQDMAEDEQTESDETQHDDRVTSNGHAGPSALRQKISISLGKKKELVCHVSTRPILCHNTLPCTTSARSAAMWILAYFDRLDVSAQPCIEHGNPVRTAMH